MATRDVAAFALFFLTAVLASAASAQAQLTEDSCVVCHGALSDSRLADPVSTFAEDIHADKGFSCVSCHGGDARELGMAAMDPARGYIGVPEGEDIIKVCGRCHSDGGFMRRYNPSLRVDQVAEYWTSEHGRRLMEHDDTHVATCVSCHPAHSIKPPSDPGSSVHPPRVTSTCGSCHGDVEYMAGYNIPTNQVEKYSASVHWETLESGDISAPTCNDCHGNHGAAPPGVSWVGNVCGQCHVVMAGLFNESFHSKVFAMLGQPGCATCHGNHEIKSAGDELLGLGEGAVCRMCHSATDKGGGVATEMRALVDSLNAGYASADSILSRAEHAGMEVSEARFSLSEALTALVSARAAVHSFDIEVVKKEVEAGLAVTTSTYALGDEALRELQVRRKGLAVSVALILLLISGVVVTIRRLEARAPSVRA